MQSISVPLFILYPKRALSSANGAIDMFSIPPATTISASPARIISAAILTQLRPDPHTTLIVTAGTSTGSPALIVACLATFCPRPAWITQPISTSSTCSGLTPARFNASLITIAPRSAAGVVLRAPPILPIAVLHAPANTTFFAIFYLHFFWFYQM